MRQEHVLKPFYNKDSKILILGSFPSVVSRNNVMYYSHPQNRFWKIMSILFDEEIVDRKEFVLKKHIALWDVIASCEIDGSSDSSIKKVVPNDIGMILNNSKVSKIFVVGKKAYDLYYKFIYKQIGMDAVLLSSTSPANANKSLDDLVEEFKVILDFLD